MRACQRTSCTQTSFWPHLACQLDAAQLSNRMDFVVINFVQGSLMENICVSDAQCGHLLLALGGF